MDAYIIPTLAILTLAVVVGAAWFSKRRTEQRRHDPEAPKSALASDGDSHRKDE